MMSNERQSNSKLGSELLSEGVTEANDLLETLGELSETICKAYQQKSQNQLLTENQKSNLEKIHIEFLYIKRDVENFLSEKINLMTSFSSSPLNDEFKQLYKKIETILQQELNPTEQLLKRDAPLPSSQRPRL